MDLDSTSLTIDVTRVLSDSDVLFKLMCAVDWLRSDGERIRVRFDVAHVAGDLALTSVHVDAPDLDRPLSDAVFVGISSGDLLQLVREWIIDSGVPNGTSAMAGVGCEDAWQQHRNNFIAMLSRRRGHHAGRPVERDDAYLRELAEQYIEIAREKPVGFRKALAEARSDDKEPEAINTDIRVAKREGWLAKSPTRGSQDGPRPGWRLLHARKFEALSTDEDEAT